MEERFEKHREFLVDRIDPDFGLLDKLRANRILTREAVHKIKLKDNTTEDKNRILLDFILKNKKANELVSALRDSGQTHLVNYLNADGGYRSTFGDDWPLSECDISHLEINCEALVDLLDTSDLCIRLFSEKVINDRQKQFILSKPTNAEKNEALLEILTKCSLRQYYKTIACLNDSNQSHIAKLLSDGGVLVRVHVNLEGAVGNVDELEEEIITQIKKVLENRPLDDATRLLDLTKLGLIAARKGQSIVIYIHCMTHDNLLQLIDLLKTDRLKRTIERIFTELVSIGDDLRVTLTWSLEEFKRAATYFEVSFKMVVGKFKRAPSHGKLILLWDSIERIVRDSEEEESTLSEEHANRIRSQYSQLLNNLTRVPDIVAQMYERHKLSDKEREHLQQFHSTPIRASEELLNIIIGKSPDVYQCFLESLQKTRQHHVYQLLSSDQQNETTDEQLVFEHSRLIRQNYYCLIESLDPDSGLLSLLFQREVLNSREYEQIRSFRDRFKKNETLLSIISRKTSENFKEFKNALIETLQSDIVEKITFDLQIVVMSENARTVREKPAQKPVVKPKSWKQTLPPFSNKQTIPLPKPLSNLKTCQPEPCQLLLQVAEKPVVIKNESTRKLFPTKSALTLKAKFSKLENELQREVSSKVAVLSQKTMSDNIWKMCIQNILQESQIVKKQIIAQTKIASEKCDKLEQSILNEKFKLKIVEDKLRIETTRSGKQNVELHGQIDDLERNLNSTVQTKENLQEKLRMTEDEIRSLKFLIQQNEKEAKEKENLLSNQLMETLDKLVLAEDKINVLQQAGNDLGNAEERVSHMQNKLLIEHEKAMNLEIQLREERSIKSARDPVEQSKLLAEASEKTEAHLNEPEGKINKTDSIRNELDAQVLLPFNDSGEVRSEEKLQSRYNSEPNLIRIITTKVSKEKNETIHGLTTLDEELFVVSRKSSDIEVFHVQKLTFCRQYKRKELVDAMDIASCKRNKRLYILDYKGLDQSKTILVVNSTGKLLQTIKTGSDYGRLSVTEESNVILTVFWKGKLNVYSPDGQLLNEMKLSPGIVHPRHAIKLTNGDFVVSHGFFASDVHGVCIVDADGELKRSYGGKSGSEIGQMNIPNYLAVDKDGFVFVADRLNNRVLLLNPDLKFEREFLSKTTYSLQYTTRICLDESNDRLLVVNSEFDSVKTVCSDGQIFIFHIK